jgi:hypothetical protein
MRQHQRRWAGGPRKFFAQPADAVREAGDRWMFEQAVNRQPDTESPSDMRDKLDPDQRIAADFEEVVAQAELPGADKVAP